MTPNPLSDPANSTRLATNDSASLVGIALNGRYEVERELKRGGFGIVYFARDRQLHSRPVVVKVLLKDAYESEYIVLKFQQEVEALSRIDHPGVVGIIDSGALANGEPFIVMQYVDGVTLRSILKAEGMEMERAAELVKQIGRALTAAHEKGILHRDLKPENIMLQSYGSGEEQVKIIDFGIAKLKDSIVGPSTVSGTTAGTVSYMAPEQLSGQPLSAAMDVFAMGAIAYELLTGRRPFKPETGFDLLDLQRRGVQASPAELRPSLSAETSQAILRALSFDPQLRFQNAREFGDILARSLSENHTAVDPLQTVRAPIAASQITAKGLARETGELSTTTIAVESYAPAESNQLANRLSQRGVKNKSRIGPRAAIALIALVMVGVATAILVWKRDAIFESHKSILAPERVVTYSLTVQKMRDGKPYQTAFESSGQEIFESGWKFRMNLTSPQEGYLYLLNEGPASGGVATFNVLFPESKTNNGSPRVNANQNLQTAWMRFDDNQGTERFWMVWAAAPVKDLEAVIGAVNDRDLGEVKDEARARAVRDFLKQRSSPKAELTKDSANEQSIVKARTDVLVSAIELKHR